MAMELLEVGDIMTPKVITADEDAPITKISKEMELMGVGSVVITKEGKPVGIVTDRDIALKVTVKDKIPREIKAKEIMSSPVITIGPDEPQERACKLMAERGIRRLLVMENDKLVGIISVRNIVTRNPACIKTLYPTE
ncbi:MAG: CBS domain-containing protein [Halobacteriota archaeon]